MERVFNVHTGNGSVYILRELDREENAWHNISVIATEFSECTPPLSLSLLLFAGVEGTPGTPGVAPVSRLWGLYSERAPVWSGPSSDSSCFGPFECSCWLDEFDLTLFCAALLPLLSLFTRNHKIMLFLFIRDFLFDVWLQRTFH